MSKYIRTKDNSIRKVYADRVTIIECEDGKSLICIDKKDILKEADTIEELCDEFVEVGSYQPTLAEVRFEHWDKTTKNILNKQRKKVYGAIWTDKGLIYVAKMNERGGLELL